MIKGWYDEEVLDTEEYITNLGIRRISKSRYIPKDHVHKIKQSSKNCISITFEGPWGPEWREYFDDGREKIYQWGRKVRYDSKYERESS